MRTTKQIGLVLVIFAVFQTFELEAKEIARVNQKSVSDMDLSISLVGLNESQKLNVMKDTILKQQILMQAINQELLAQEAERLKLQEDVEFKSALNFQRNQLLISKLIEQKIAPLISESEAKKYYQKHKDKFGPNLVRVQQILLENEANALAILKKAKEPNSDFQMLAETYSIDPNAKNNRGEVGFLAVGQVDPALTDAAFKASVGAVVGPIRNLAGYHLLKVMEKKSGRPLEYGDVEIQVKAALKDELVGNYLDVLRKTAKINIDHTGL